MFIINYLLYFIGGYVMNLEERIKNIEERNKKVELDKRWETKIK